MSTSLPNKPSQSTIRRNPTLYSGLKSSVDAPQSHPVVQKVSEQPKRIRQRVKPLMNDLECRFYDTLVPLGKRLYAQSLTFQLANGLKYTPDIFCFDWSWRGIDRPVAWEVKGDWFPDDAVAKLKMFATVYPKILVLLAWESDVDKVWRMQIVYP